LHGSDILIEIGVVVQREKKESVVDLSGKNEENDRYLRI
jgi:hypothetical protein